MLAVDGHANKAGTPERRAESRDAGSGAPDAGRVEEHDDGAGSAMLRLLRGSGGDDG